MQVLVVHGGETFATYDEFIARLTTKEIDLEKLNYRDWKSTLPEALGTGYHVLQPKMPNRENAKYAEWKLWFERFTPYIEDGVVFVGHSLGAVFLAKYLTEETFSKKIRATFLVAAPFDTDEDRGLAEFIPPNNLEKLQAQGGEIFLYHSKDDLVVPCAELEKYRERLPLAEVTVFDNRQHFNQEQFPELVAHIIALT